MKQFLNKHFIIPAQIRAILRRNKIISNILSISHGLICPDDAVDLDEHELALTA